MALSAGCGGEGPGEDNGSGETSEAVRATEIVRGYKLPFTPGATDTVTQYPHGYRDQIWNAIDIGVPLGGNVLAMKAGTVSAVVDTNADHAYPYACQIAACNDTTNFVIIQHDDGQESSYLHLARQSASALGIMPGAHVCQGQVIGRVGLNGYTSGPHVHVSVQAGGSAGARAQAWSAMWSKPTKVIHFDEANGELAQGRRYESQNEKACGTSSAPPSTGGTPEASTKDAGAEAPAVDASAPDASEPDASAPDASVPDHEADPGEWDGVNASGVLGPEEQPDPQIGEGPRPPARRTFPRQASAGCSASPTRAPGGAVALLALAVVVAGLLLRRSRLAGVFPI